MAAPAQKGSGAWTYRAPWGGGGLGNRIISTYGADSILRGHWTGPSRWRTDPGILWALQGSGRVGNRRAKKPQVSLRLVTRDAILGQGLSIFVTFLKQRLAGPWVLPWCLRHINNGLLRAESRVMKPHCCSVKLEEKTVFLTHLSPGEHSKLQRSAQEARIPQFIPRLKTNELKSFKSPHHKRQLF